MYKLVVFVPDEAKESLKEALFAEGAGAQGAYSHCSWECLGVGQFLPGNSSNPQIGSIGTIEQVDEWRIEMLVPEIVLEPVKNALYDAHPYEEPAFDLIRLEDIPPRT